MAPGGNATGQKPSLKLVANDIRAEHGKLGLYAIHFEGPDEIKFCENETNVALYGSEDSWHLPAEPHPGPYLIDVRPIDGHDFVSE